MDTRLIHEMIRQLRREMSDINSAISALERIAAKQPRRGRPPNWIGRLKNQALAGVIAASRDRRKNRRAD